MRAALSLPADAGEQHFRAAAGRVSKAMDLARKPLGLDEVPGFERIVEALRAWYAEFVMSAAATDAGPGTRAEPLAVIPS